MSETAYESFDMEQAIAEKGEVITTVVGISMYPMLRQRKDMIVVEKVNRPLKKYDVPLYRLESGKLVLHRILKVTENSYIIRGDNLLDKELNITDDNIIGVLKAFYRGGKYYDCEKSIPYKIYIHINRMIFPLRYVWKKFLKPFLVKIKHKIFK